MWVQQAAALQTIVGTSMCMPTFVKCGEANGAFGCLLGRDGQVSVLAVNVPTAASMVISMGRSERNSQGPEQIQ